MAPTEMGPPVPNSVIDAWVENLYEVLKCERRKWRLTGSKGKFARGFRCGNCGHRQLLTLRRPQQDSVHSICPICRTGMPEEAKRDGRKIPIFPPEKAQCVTCEETPEYCLCKDTERNRVEVPYDPTETLQDEWKGVQEGGRMEDTPYHPLRSDPSPTDVLRKDFEEFKKSSAVSLSHAENSVKRLAGEIAMIEKRIGIILSESNPATLVSRMKAMEKSLADALTQLRKQRDGFRKAFRYLQDRNSDSALERFRRDYDEFTLKMESELETVRSHYLALDKEFTSVKEWMEPDVEPDPPKKKGWFGG